MKHIKLFETFNQSDFSGAFGNALKNNMPIAVVGDAGTGMLMHRCIVIG
jgi:hypothetical protein